MSLAGPRDGAYTGRRRGVILFVAPGAGALALVWLIAAFAIVEGLLLLALAFRLRGLAQGPSTLPGRMGTSPGAA